MIKIKDLSRKWKVVRGEIRGSLGDVYVCCSQHLAIYLNSRAGKKKAKSYGWEMMQNGTRESSFKLPFSDLDKAALLVDAEKAPTKASF